MPFVTTNIITIKKTNNKATKQSKEVDIYKRIKVLKSSLDSFKKLEHFDNVLNINSDSIDYWNYSKELDRLTKLIQ